MAFASVGTLGSNNNKLSGTNNLAITTGAAAAIGSLIVVAVAADNISTSDGNTTEHDVTDSAGNTYTRAREFCNGQASSPAGATVSIWYAKVYRTLDTGGTITLTTTGAITAKAMTAWNFTIASNTALSVEDGTDVANDGADPGALSLTLINEGEHLWVRATAHEGPTEDAYTADADYTLMTANGTTGSTSTSNMSLRAEFRIVSGATDTNDPTWTAADHASALVALLETVPTAVPNRPATRGSRGARRGRRRARDSAGGRRTR